MAKVFIEESTLTKIGNSIRNKTGKTELIDPAVMDLEIDSIVSGGGGDLPEEALKITGNCQHRFANNGWNWFIEEFGNRITTENIDYMFQMFVHSGNLTRIPFTLNINNCKEMPLAFGHCSKLEECPKVRGNLIWDTSTKISSVTEGCSNLADVEDLFDSAMLDGFSNVKVTSSYSTPNVNGMFNGCWSLRRVPSWFYKLKLNEESTAAPSQYYVLYYNMFSACYTLNEALNIPVWNCSVPTTANMFSNSLNNTCMLKNFTFETQEDGTPYTTQWKSQIIDLSSYTGWASTRNYIINYNSGVTEDKLVRNDDTYQALKDDPDWFTESREYSRYNHDSAVVTINSLPDTSAYLATAGGTNTIKFKGEAGSLTDGGAINTLTEEEIAVAVAKGWTVTLV